MSDLLRCRFFGKLAASRSYPLTAQVITLLGFGLIVAGGLAAPHVSAKMTGTLRNTNLAALVVWSLWWPLVIISAAAFQAKAVDITGDRELKMGADPETPAARWAT